MISSRVVPLAIVSKAPRHTTLSVTVNIYGHVSRKAAQSRSASMSYRSNPPAAIEHAASVNTRPRSCTGKNPGLANNR